MFKPVPLLMQRPVPAVYCPHGCGKELSYRGLVHRLTTSGKGQVVVQTVRYRGKADIRIITSDQLSDAGLSAPTLTWQKSNGYEIVLDDPVAAFVLAQGDFEPGDPNIKFGDLFDVPVRTDWSKDTLTNPVEWQQETISVDGAQVINWSVVNRRLRFSGPTQGLGNMRTVLLHPNTLYKSAYVKSLWWGPNEFNQNPTRRPQLGHVHNFVDDGARKRFIAVWQTVIGGPELIHVAIWESDDTTLFLGDIVNSGDLRNTTRVGRLVWAKRLTFGGTLLQANVVPNHAVYTFPVNGIAGKIADNSNTSLNSPAAHSVTAAVRTAGVATLTTSVAHGRSVGQVVLVDLVDNSYDGLHVITEVPSTTQLRFSQPGMSDAGTSTGTAQWMFVSNGGGAADNVLQVTHSGADVTDTTAGGLWTPEYPWRVMPYWVKSWVEWTDPVTPVVYVKQWAYGMPEPADGHPTFTAGPIAIGLGSATAIPSSEGLHGVIGAHAHGGNFGEYDNVEIGRRRAA